MQRWEAPLIIDMLLVILGLYLEVRLGMVANGTYLWGLLANNDMSTVGTLPNNVAIL